MWKLLFDTAGLGAFCFAWSLIDLGPLFLNARKKQGPPSVGSKEGTP